MSKKEVIIEMKSNIDELNKKINELICLLEKARQLQRELCEMKIEVSANRLAL
jgi:cob(I)alamin adenosyltransferase